MMGLPSFVRRVLGHGSFPQMVGQELPDPVVAVETVAPVSPAIEPVVKRKPRKTPKPTNS